MDFFQTALQSPFVWGLMLGLLVAGFILKSSLTARNHAKLEARRLEKELRELQDHLHTQLKITAKGNETTQVELEELRRQNENLRVNLAAVQQKPGRAELRQLRIYEVAIGIMREQAPGFAPAWEKALRQGETTEEAAESGLKRLMQRVIPGLGHRPTSSVVALEEPGQD